MATNANAQRIIDACFKHWDANKADCNAFVKAVCKELTVPIPAGANADGIVDFLASDAAWTELTKGDGKKAKGEADAGKLIIGGMRSNEHDPPRLHGHVLVVMSGALDGTHGKYPRAAWGTLGGVGEKDSFVNFSFNVKDRDRVRYFFRTLP